MGASRVAAQELTLRVSEMQTGAPPTPPPEVERRKRLAVSLTPSPDLSPLFLTQLSYRDLGTRL